MTKIACIGGFLGSGKTTAVIEAARILTARGLRVGIITNDQGHHLVDTALVRSLGFQAAEIGGGCFCCRFPEFASNAERLAEQAKAQVILAEAVGSCTDLSATVCRRLRQYHAAQFSVAPLTVMVEPGRIREMLADRSPFNEDVRYLFGKQLAEADRIILTKADLLRDEEVQQLQENIREFVGPIPVSSMSARNGNGVAQWVDLILSDRAGERRIDLDYDTYGAAEAALGWLNATIDLSAAARDFSASEIAEAILAAIQSECRKNEKAVAHVKVMIVTAHGSNWIALTGTGAAATWGEDQKLPDSREASIIINARVCTQPEILKSIVEEAVRQVVHARGITAAISHIESFAPLPPTPPADLVLTEN